MFADHACVIVASVETDSQCCRWRLRTFHIRTHAMVEPGAIAASRLHITPSGEHNNGSVQMPAWLKAEARTTCPPVIFRRVDKGCLDLELDSLRQTPAFGGAFAAAEIHRLPKHVSASEPWIKAPRDTYNRKLQKEKKHGTRHLQHRCSSPNAFHTIRLQPQSPKQQMSERFTAIYRL